MCAMIILTQEQREAVRRDMDQQEEMLSDQEIELLASKLNEKIDLPLFSEAAEQLVCVKTVRIFDRLLYRSLPNELYGLVKDANDGLTTEEAENLKQVLSTRLNQSLDLPYLPEWVEQKIFYILIDLIVDAMLNGFSIMSLP